MKGVTIYDEVALANDINAACAAAGHLALQASVTSTSQSIEDRIERLKSLFDKKVITEQEYKERRAKLLDEV
jgi:hypothetical protein